MPGKQIIGELTAATLKKLYENKDNNVNTDSIQYDNALHMIAKFLIQGIRALGIFRNGDDDGYVKDTHEKYDLSGIHEVYETFKKCAYREIFGEIDHTNTDFNIVQQALRDDTKVMLKDMIDQMVDLYKGTLTEYRPKSKYMKYCPTPDTPKISVIFTLNEKAELTRRFRYGILNAKTNSTFKNVDKNWIYRWHDIFTVIFGPPFFPRPEINTHNPTMIEGEPVGTISIFQSGGKSTRRARTKKAHRAKRHTRRAARREYRGR
jgi:hypothetical protein